PLARKRWKVCRVSITAIGLFIDDHGRDSFNAEKKPPYIPERLGSLKKTRVKS
ncbi:MAG: hypothetical protein QOG58_1168, partial [Caballeronia sp.]|nr:hypothetical protein [Caballeronia sp.]